ncbi:MAG: hypothetical protein IJP52_05585 [Paludibacteraceae bacterium]|nr:hypothetical protein [Paludibacteraceae bacterium]
MRNFYKNLKTLALTLTRVGHKSDSILSRFCLVSLILLVMGGFTMNAWGSTLKGKTAVGSGKGTAKVEVCYYSGAVVDDNSTTGSSLVEAKTSAVTGVSWFYCTFTATPADGYYFDAWYTNSACSQGKQTANSYSTGYYKSTFGTREDIYYARFLPVTVSSAGSASTSFNHPEPKTVTLYFPVSDKADANADFNAPTIEANTGWSISSWNLNTSTHKVEVICSYTASSDISKGAHSATVTLKAKSNNSNTGTVTANVDLTPTLTYKNSSVDISVSDADKTIINVDTLRTAYKGADNVAGDGTITYSLKTVNSNVSLTSAGIFYAKAEGTYTIVASATKKRYYAQTAEFTITVGKRTPVITWDEPEHIYASNVLSNPASASYKGNNVTLTRTYTSLNEGVMTVNGTNITANPQLTVESNCTIRVVTTGTGYYKSVTAEHVYFVEPKATPLFKLNGEDLPESPVKSLNLLIGETATMTFENTDETNNRFSYPQNNKITYVTYDHSTGIITGKKAGDEVIQFAQTGTPTIFEHTRSIHVYVHKHNVTLTTTLNGGTWKVDSVYTGSVYGIETTTGDANQAMNAVTVTSSNENVLKPVDGGWKAVGAGQATLTIAQANNDYWTGDTITATITVEKYVPTITWHLEASYPWGAHILTPVTSSNEELPFTLTSSDPTKADYVDGKIEVYNVSGNVTFTLSQQGNYKWADAAQNLTFMFNCFKPENHVPFTLATNNYKHYEKSTSRASWSSPGYYLGDGGWTTKDDYVIIRFTGIPQTLSFDKILETSWGQLPGTHLCQVYESVDGNSWGAAIWTHDERVAQKNGNSVNLQPSTRYIKFAYHGTVYCDYNNISVTERKEVSAPTSVTFPTNSVDASANTQTVNVNWYNIKPCTVTITGPNASFFHLADDSPEIASAIDDYGTKAIKVSYAYPEGGTHTATLHIESEDGYTANVALSATSNKLTPAITWKENLTPMSRGENVENPALSPVTLVYTSTDSTVVDIEGNTLKPLKKGTATITASFDGTSDTKYNSNSSTIDVEVTDMKVLHITWPQTFTRLKYSSEKPEKTTANFALTATVSYFDPDTKEEINIDRTVTFTSGDNTVVQVLKGNILHVVGEGNTTLTAHVDGIENEFIEANVVRAVKVREPSTDCDTYILEDAHESLFTEINSFDGVKKEYTLSGEPGYLTFSAWTERWYLGKIGFDPAGDLKVAQLIDGEWNAIWSNGLQVGVEQSFGPIELDRRATKIKFYKEVGSTCYHNFAEGYITLARYVELDNTPKKTTSNIAFTTSETKPGVAVVKTFTVNYSNITDQLQVDLTGSDKFSILSATTIGEECGDKGTATVEVQFLSNDVAHYEGTITVHNENQSVTVNLSADVDKHAQQITWNPETTDLKTTDNVTFDATTSGSAAGLSVTYVVTEGSDVATVNETTGELTIIKDGTVTIEARAAGNDSYYAATAVPTTFTISKVTPSITAIPMAATMTMPNTNLGSCGLTGGTASVDGSFAWLDKTINATLNNTGYTVVFTPDNDDWYNTATCTVVVPVNKQVNTITWDFNVTEMYCNADYTFDATATSGLDIRYETSNASSAYVDGNNHLSIITGGEVTITAYQDGDDDWAAATPVSKTFTIRRFTPQIITLPTAAPMSIGCLLSNASLTGGYVSLDNVQVLGSFAWENGNTQVENTAGTFPRTVIFTPSNTNYYEPVSTTMNVVVEKYGPTITSNNLQATSIEFPQTLSYSTLSGTVTAWDYVKVPNVEVTGTVVWQDETTVLRPGQQTGIALFVPDSTDWYNAVPLSVNVVVTGGYVFDGTTTSWTEQTNWEGNLVPGTDDPVIIKKDVEITTNVMVGSLMIDKDINVIVKDGGVLNVGSDDSGTGIGEYGNLRVNKGGEVKLNGTLKVNDFIIESAIGTSDGTSRSGQLENVNNLQLYGDAYIDITFDPSGTLNTTEWYGFTVPFTVNGSNGIYQMQDDSTFIKATYGVHYILTSFDGTRRATTGKGWKHGSTILQPGRFYMFGGDSHHNTYRFKQMPGTALPTTNTSLSLYDAADGSDANWNAVGNATLHHVSVAFENSGLPTYVQVFENGASTYKAISTNEANFVVGCPFFIQAKEKTELILNNPTAATAYYAPARNSENAPSYKISIEPEDGGYSDQIYISASQEASAEYEIGHDLSKAGIGKRTAQMWVNAYGKQLCVNEAELNNSVAQYNLGMYAPANGGYRIAASATPEEVTLYLTMNGNIIWNLSKMPYVADLMKGESNEYGILMLVQKSNVSTDVENINNPDNEGIEKIILNNRLYILRDGEIYDATGAKIQ